MGGLTWASLVSEESLRSPQELDAFETARQEWGLVDGTEARAEAFAAPADANAAKTAELNTMLGDALAGSGMAPMGWTGPRT